MSFATDFSTYVPSGTKTGTSKSAWITSVVVIVIFTIAGVLTWLFWPSSSQEVPDPITIPPTENTDATNIQQVLTQSPWRPFSVLYPRDQPIKVRQQGTLEDLDPIETQSATKSFLTSSRNGTYILQYLEDGYDIIGEVILEYTGGERINLDVTFDYPYQNSQGFGVNNSGNFVIVGNIKGSNTTALIRKIGSTIATTNIDGSNQDPNAVNPDTVLPLQVLCSENYFWLRYANSIVRRSLFAPATNVVTLTSLATTHFGYLGEDQLVYSQSNGTITVVDISDPFNVQTLQTVNLANVSALATSGTRIAAAANEVVYVYGLPEPDPDAEEDSDDEDKFIQRELQLTLSSPKSDAFDMLTTGFGTYIDVSDKYVAVGSSRTIWVYDNENPPQWVSAQDITSCSISDIRLNFTVPKRNLIQSFANTS